jgi:hypothetical protein
MLFSLFEFGESLTEGAQEFDWVNGAVIAFDEEASENFLVFKGDGTESGVVVEQQVLGQGRHVSQALDCGIKVTGVSEVLESAHFLKFLKKDIVPPAGHIFFV